MLALACAATVKRIPSELRTYRLSDFPTLIYTEAIFLTTAHPETLLLSAVLRTGEYQVLAAHGITAGMFHVHDHEFQWLENYVARTSKTPSKQAWKSQYPEFSIYKVDDVEHWCEEVKTSHKRQSMIDLMDEVLNHVDAGDEDTALASLEAGVERIRTVTSGINPDFNVFDDWDVIYDSVKDRVDKVAKTGFAGVPTGFSTLDDLTGGLQGGWLCVVAARLGQGKTWTGVRMAYAAAMAGERVTYFSLEQSKLQIAMRVHAFGSRQFSNDVFNPMDLNRGHGFDIQKYKQFLDDMQKHRGNGEFYINDTSRGIVTPSTIASVIQTKQPSIVFVDYLTLLGTTADDWRGTAKLSSELQSVAQRYNVPIVAMSQVNRLGISKEPPGAEHLSQADAIGQDADVVLTMTQRSQHVMKMKLAKFRHGPGGGSWNAKFSPGTGEYMEITNDEADDLIEEDQEDE